MGRLLIILLWAAILYLLWNSLFSSRRRRIHDNRDEAVNTMVHDPNCNTFVPKNSAIHKRVAGKEHYFCSKDCFREYREKNKT